VIEKFRLVTKLGLCDAQVLKINKKLKTYLQQHFEVVTVVGVSIVQVFLLAVGEMFPASTGPYLGVYFVISMALLCLNLLMTVLVLHMHFKPVVIKNHMSKEKTRKISQFFR